MEKYLALIVAKRLNTANASHQGQFTILLGLVIQFAPIVMKRSWSRREMPQTIRIKSFSRDIYHNVRQLSNGDWWCDCENFSYRGHKDGACDHIRKARHQKMRRHGLDAMRLRKKTRAIKRYNHLCRKYRFTAERLSKLTPKQIKTTARIKERLKIYKKEIKRIVKAYPEMVKK